MRGGQFGARRSTRVPAPAVKPPTPLADATVLITGGTGGLGAVFARHLVAEHGVRRLVLTSRRGHEAPGVAALVRALTQAGADARVVACDVADRDAIRDLLGTIAADDRLAVIHTAGVFDDGTVESLTAEQVDRVLAPKVDGAWHLHELTRDRDVSAFVLFSSIAGPLGSAGQSNYAAANGYLDALAQQRREAGLTATALAWGPWQQESGMTGDLDRAAVARWERMGFDQLGDAEGVRLFDQALAHPRRSWLRSGSMRRQCAGRPMSPRFPRYCAASCGAHPRRWPGRPARSAPAWPQRPTPGAQSWCSTSCESTRPRCWATPRPVRSMSKSLSASWVWTHWAVWSSVTGSARRRA